MVVGGQMRVGGLEWSGKVRVHECVRVMQCSRTVTVSARCVSLCVQHVCKGLCVVCGLVQMVA